MTGAARIPVTVANALTEEQFQQQLIDLARLQGWAVYHTRDSRRSEPGFPDLICIRGQVLLALEVKRQDGSLTEPQRFWLQRFAMAEEIVARVVRPADWPELEGLLAR